MSNDCYVRALMQCLRVCTPCTDLDRYVPPHDGRMGDPHELYMRFIESVPTSLSNRYKISLSNGDRVYYLPECLHHISGIEDIVSAPEILCIYRIPSPIRIGNMYYMQITVRGHIYTYMLRCCICYQHGSSGASILRWHGYNLPNAGTDHYYSITDCSRTDDVPAYMLFYKMII